MDMFFLWLLTWYLHVQAGHHHRTPRRTPPRWTIGPSNAAHQDELQVSQSFWSLERGLAWEPATKQFRVSTCCRCRDETIDLRETDRTDQGCALVVLAVNSTAAGKDKKPLFWTDNLCDPEARQGFALNGCINIGIKFPTQEAPGNHFLQGSLERNKTVLVYAWALTT